MVLNAGCLCQKKEINYPPYPQNVTGWKYHKENGVGVLGYFILKKGESTNNGKVEITVVEIIPAEACADLGTARAKNRVTLEFIRMSDNKSLCVGTYIEDGGGNTCDEVSEEFWINGIGVRGINIKDQWVHFMLGGAEK